VTGPIEIKPKSITGSKASLMVRGPLAVRHSLDVRPDDSKAGLDIDSINASTKYVVINGSDAQLHASTDIDGCALSAKWC